jgi:branched-chain amino acid transport system substrate-binding protein
MTRIWGSLIFGSIIISIACTRGAPTTEPYKIGINAALTGPAADTYGPVYEAINIYFQKVNDTGGINSHPVRLLAEDDTSDATRAGANATKLVQQERVPVLLLASPATTYGPVINTTKSGGIPLLMASVCPKEALPPSDPLIFCTASFGVLYDSAFAVKFIKEEAIDAVKLGLVALDNPISRVGIDHAEKLAGDLGIQVVIKLVVPAAVTDYTPFAAQIQQAGANWVFAWAPWSPQIGPFEALQKLGWRGNYLLWAHQPAEEEFNRRKADNLYGLAGQSMFVEDLPIHKEIRAVAQKYKTTYPVEHLTEGWVAAMALEQALQRCGWPCSAREMQAALNTLDVDTKGLRGGKLTFTPDNHFRTKTYYKVYRWDTLRNTIITVRDWVGIDIEPGR